MTILDVSEDVCNKILKHEYYWSEKTVRQARKCLELINKLRQMESKSEIEYSQAVVHDMFILASFCTRSKPRIEV